MTKKYMVMLETEEREKLLALISSGIAKARTITHARILLKAEEGWQDQEICKALNVSIPTVERVRKRFVLEGFERSLRPRRPKRVYSRKLDGEQEARMVALACSSPPEGYARWSLRLLADWVVQMKIIESISHETVRHVLDDNELKPWRRQEWCIPVANAEFVYHMEDVLDVYKRPIDPKHPLVCFDESPEQLVSETRQGSQASWRSMTTNIDAKGWPICSCSLHHFKTGGVSKSPSGAPKWTGLTACVIWWMFIFRKLTRL